MGEGKVEEGMSRKARLEKVESKISLVLVPISAWWLLCLVKATILAQMTLF